jgi:hypothetical protein
MRRFRNVLSSLDPDQPKKDPCMSRLISKLDCPDKNQLGEWLRNQTGGMVSVIGEPIDRDMCWEVLVFSSDGKPASTRS